MKTKMFFLVFAVSIFLFASCKKDFISAAHDPVSSKELVNVNADINYIRNEFNFLCSNEDEAKIIFGTNGVGNISIFYFKNGIKLDSMELGFTYTSSTENTTKMIFPGKPELDGLYNVYKVYDPSNGFLLENTKNTFSFFK